MKRAPLAILFITLVIDLLGFGIILPLLPVYVSKFGGSPLISGLLTTSFSLAQFIFSPIWGRASDHWGRRPLILLSLFGSSVAFLLFGLAHSLWMLFAARVGGGILTAASIPVAQAYIADVTPPERRARGMALLGIAFGIGFAFGPWIGALLGRHSLALPAFFVAGLAFANVLLAFFLLPESHHRTDPPGERPPPGFLNLAGIGRAFRSPSLGGLITVFSVNNLAFAFLESTFTWLILIRFLGLNPAGQGLTREMETQAAPMVGPIFGIVGVTIMIVQGAMMSGLAQRLGELRLVRSGAMLLTLTLFGIGAATSLTWLKVLSALIAVGSGILNPSLSSLISQFAGAHERGAILGTQQGLGSLARMVAPPLGTWLLQRFGTATPYYLAGVLMFAAFLLSIRIQPPPPAGPTAGSPLH